ncbi:AsmA family protein [Roseovarius rhodophyticola]|uniref:AsmA family protein n=1 Tax=Roseovarius rhodophyticola TaxID=3080827 RepID=A0ABZ2TD76_9RHOB|nr:AsmA family protein [Roseovarius sp. W115]MDV2930774.1 AsmA family protein [Roseovarius sp. W115]
MRWIVRLLGLLIVVALLAVVSVFLLPGDRIAKIAADQISNMTGRQVTMTGDTTVSFYPVLGISTGAVTVANADWAGDTPMFQAESLKIGVEPQALFGGDIRITGLEAIGPQINLRRDKNGRVNWELGVEGVAPSGQSDDGAPARSSRLALTLDRALIQNASFSFVDELNGTTTQQSGVDFDLRWPDYEGAAEFELGLQPAGERVSVKGKLERVGHFISGGVSDVVATVSTSAGTANFTGKAGSTPEFAGTFSADAKDTSALMVALGLGPMEIPRGLGRAAKLDTSVTFTNERRLSLRDTRLQLDGNAFTGAADVDMSGAKPRLNVQLNAGALDLTGLSSANNESSGNGSSASSDASSGWSKSPINASGLGAVDGEFALVADSIDLGDFKLGKTRTLASLDRSRLVFQLREVQAYAGLITGEFVMNNRSGLSVGGTMTANGIDLERFLKDAMDVSRLSGNANGNVSFLASGASVHAIMNSLSGDGAVSMARGVISGFDLDRIMRGGQPGGGTTVFDTMSATFRMENGNMFNNDLSMRLPQASASGEGRVGLGARDIDYTFTPILLDSGDGRGLAIPVRLRGPWSNVRIQPDLEKAIDLNLAAEKKELEEKAKQEVERTLEKELGLDREDGQSLEDAAEDALKKELGRGLRNLFD